MKEFRIGGVPEHFNLPWYLTLSNKEYHAHGINLRWNDYHGGTGQMCKALRNREIDMAVILTEGIVRDIHLGNDVKIVQVYVRSPLIWGIHVAPKSKYHSLDELRGKKAAISRYGSGSHLMTYVHAEAMGWDLENDLKFELVNNLEGALSSIPNGESDYFLWEKFTTKPYVDDGFFRLLDECPTPWPCFVIAVRNDILFHQEEEIKAILQVINKNTTQFKNLKDIDKRISVRYDQKLQDVNEWLSLTEWDQEQITVDELDLVQKQLLKLNLIDEILPSEDLLHKF
jgi:ABC-type nitrate/sulfonate/bicarbonate transport system substrate-binding protein